MNSNMSRRKFMKSSTIGASAIALGTSGIAKGFPANEKVQLGWIGIGGRCRGLIKHMSKLTGYRTVAVCDLKPDRIEVGQKMMAQDNPKGYKDFRKMMEKEKMDGIIVATEPNNHAPLVVPVLEAGFHCFAEKPMDTTVERVDAIVKAARKAKGFYQIGTQRRYSPTFLKAMPVILGGKIGKVTFMQGHWHWPWQTAKGNGVRDGWGLVEQAVHHMDIMSWAMGEKHPETCAGMAYNQLHLPPAKYRESHSATAFKFPDGQILSYTHLFHLPQHFQDEKLWVFCEQAGVDVPGGMMYWREKKDNPDERIAEDATGQWGTGQVEQLADFLDNIKTGGKRIPNANVETGRVATLMSIMGRTAMMNIEKNNFEPRIIKWKDLGSTTDKS